jgi:hypothetical protein
MKRDNTGHITVVGGEVIASNVASGVKAVSVHNPYGGRAYLTIKTTTEAGTATLNLAITSAFPIGTARTVVSALADAITQAGTYVYLIGITSAGDGSFIIEAFDYPLPPDFVITFTCGTGGGTSSFVLTAALDFC